MFVALVSNSQNNEFLHANNSGKIVFKEDFEEISLSEIFANWEDVKNAEGMNLSDDVPLKSKGNQSLMMTYTPNENDGGHLYRVFPEGYDSLYARFYIKFLTRNSAVSHLVQMGGNNPLTKWPKGYAGNKTKGDDSFITCVEPLKDKWEWGFYTYWMNMRPGANNKYFGNYFTSTSPKKVEEDKWICVEFMVKLNDPVEKSNGEQALWINGEKVIHMGKGFPNGNWIWGTFHNNSESKGFEGFRWRNSDQLKINFFWLSYFMTDGTKGEIDKVLFDDLVISTEYIGPL